MRIGKLLSNILEFKKEKAANQTTTVPEYKEDLQSHGNKGLCYVQLSVLVFTIFINIWVSPIVFKKPEWNGLDAKVLQSQRQTGSCDGS